MLLNKKNKKRGASTIVFVFALPVIMLMLSFMVDLIAAENTRNRLQRQLDIASLTVAVNARDTACHVSPEDIEKGIVLFDQNTNGQYIGLIQDVSTEEDKRNGITHFEILAESTMFFSNYYMPGEFKSTMFVKSTSVCVNNEDGNIIIP